MKDHCLAATRYWKERWKCCEIGYLNGIPLAEDELTKLIVSSYFTKCQATGFTLPILPFFLFLLTRPCILGSV